MKLFGANYARGQSSVGRDASDPTAVSRAQFAAATAETGVGSAMANAGEAIARAGSIQANTGETMVRTGSIMAGEITAKGQIFKALNQTADVLDSWDKASDSVRANEALARYVDGTVRLVDGIKTQPTVKAASLPDGYLRPDDTREDIPTWEVAPKLYDAAERELYKEALSKVTRLEHRQELDVQLTNKRSANASTIRNHYVTEQKKDMVGRNEEAIRLSVQNGKPQDAINSIETGFKAGIYDYNERIKKIEKVWHDDEDLRMARRIGNTTSEVLLNGIADEVLTKQESRLTPDERRAYANQARTKGEAIAKANETIRVRKERDDSKRALGTVAERVRLEGYIPTAPELAELRKSLTPTDYLALLTMVDRKDGNGQVKSDPATLRDLDMKIMSLGKPDASGLPNHLRADAVLDQIMMAFVNNKVDAKDREQRVAMLERYRDRAIKKSPEHSQAEDLIEASLMPPKTILSGLSLADATRHGALAAEMKLELNDATRKDPRLDPVAWTKKNMPRYKELSLSKSYETLFAMGLGSYAKPGPGGKFDTTATRAALEIAKRKDEISNDLFVRAINELSKVKPPVPGADKEER